jgi:putative thioredoxin
VLLKLAEEFQGRFLLVSVNTDNEKALAEEYGVRSLPACNLFRNGRPVEEVRGMQPEADYRKLIERHSVALADKVQAAALKAWREEDRDRALQVLAEGAVAEPDRAELPLLLAKFLMQLERYEDAYSVLTSVTESLRRLPEINRLRVHLDFVLTSTSAPPLAEFRQRLVDGPTDMEARFALASTHLVADDYAAAMDQLLAIHRAAPSYRQGIAREGLLALFELLGPEDRQVQRYRNELSNFSH